MKFSDPDSFDILRNLNPHLAFAAGVHHCLGASLARLEGQEVFMALAQRFRRFKLETAEPSYEALLGVRKLRELEVSR